MVNEIDKLNRSRKAIKEFKAIKVCMRWYNVHFHLKIPSKQDELDKLKAAQKEFRDRRDQMFKERNDLKKKEDNAKNVIRDLRDTLEDMKLQIETSAADKRNSTTEF